MLAALTVTGKTYFCQGQPIWRNSIALLSAPSYVLSPDEMAARVHF